MSTRQMKNLPQWRLSRNSANDIRKFEESAPTPPRPNLLIGEALLFHNGIGGGKRKGPARLFFALLD